MSEIYNEYEKELLDLIGIIKKSVQSLGGSDNSDANANWISEADRCSREAAARLKDMDLEVRAFDANTKKVYVSRNMEHRTTYNTVQSEYQLLKEQKQRSQLIGKDSQSQRQRMITINDKLANQNNTILAAQLACQGAEETGETILQELGKNREIIQGIKSKTEEFSGTMETADKQVRSMQKRANREKNCIIS